MLLSRKIAQIPKDELLFSGKDLVKLMIPLFLQQVLSVLVGTVDSMMVSHAGEAAVSGVSLVNTLDTVLVVFFTAMVGGGAVVVAHALGRRDTVGVYESAKQLIYIATAAATLVTVIVLTLRGPLLSFLFGDVDAEVMGHANDYFFFVALSFPLLAIESSVSGCLRAAGDTKIALLVSILMNLINIGGNAILIYGFELGAMGAAISTLFSRTVGATVLITIFLNKKRTVHVENLFHYKPDFTIIKKILHIGVPNGIENAMFQFGRLLTQTLISSMGTSVIAANAVGLTISGFQYMTGTACSNAVITVIGRCKGAGEMKQIKYYSRLMLAVNYVAIWTVILFTLIFLGPIVSLYGLSEASADLAKQLIIYHMSIATVIWPIGFMLPSVFRAQGDVHYSLVVSMLSMWVFRVAGSYFCALDNVNIFGLYSISGLNMGIMGVWFAMTVDWLFRASLFLYHYFKKERQLQSSSLQ